MTQKSLFDSKRKSLLVHLKMILNSMSTNLSCLHINEATNDTLI